MTLKEHYQKKSVPLLKHELKLKNELDLPRLEKVVVSLGLSEARFEKNAVEERIKTLAKITGQKPVPAKAKKAISNFKIRAGQIVAYNVTLRGERMYDFMNKLINIVLPRIRDFRGLPTYSIDQQGNISLGIREQIVFPEIKMEEAEKMHGLGVTIVTTAKDKREAIALLKALGAVLSHDKRKKEENKLESIKDLREKREFEGKEALEKTIKTESKEEE